MGYPSALHTVAEYALQSGDSLPPARGVFTSAERLTEHVRHALETAWQCRVFDRYGAVEGCASASQCEFGRYHVSPEVGIIEILDAEGRDAAPGVEGEVVCTGLQNLLQPLIRYRLGDVARWSRQQDCPCGRMMPILEGIDGRLEDSCYTADGRRIVRFDTVFKGVANVMGSASSPRTDERVHHHRRSGARIRNTRDRVASQKHALACRRCSPGDQVRQRHPSHGRGEVQGGRLSSVSGGAPPTSDESEQCRIAVTTQTEVDRIRADCRAAGRHHPRRRLFPDARCESVCSPAEGAGALQVMRRERVTPLTGKKILDIGCGNGRQLLQFMVWGASVENLAGIDLIEARVANARAQFGSHAGNTTADLRVGDASTLPWPDATFDVVHQSMVFTSILDWNMKVAVAHEITRVLRPGGVLLWYDFFVDNPRNPHVKGIGGDEIRALFRGCSVTFRRVTLAPPLARWLVPITWTGALLVEQLRFLNTHYLVAIRRVPT